MGVEIHLFGVQNIKSHPWLRSSLQLTAAGCEKNQFSWIEWHQLHFRGDPMIRSSWPTQNELHIWGVSFVWGVVCRGSWLGVCFSFLRERKTWNQMNREVGRNPDKSYGKGKNMIKLYSQKQIKIQKIKLKSITNHLIWKLENICNAIEKSLIDLSFSGYNSKGTVHERKILHFSLSIKIYLWKTQFYDWKERLDTGHTWQHRQSCRHIYRYIDTHIHTHI